MALSRVWSASRRIPCKQINLNQLLSISSSSHLNHVNQQGHHRMFSRISVNALLRHEDDKVFNGMYRRSISSAILPNAALNFEVSSKGAEAAASAGSGAASSSADVVDLTGFVVSDAPVNATAVLSEVINDAALTTMDVKLISWLPTGWIFNGLQYLHEFLPWWAAIGALTVFFRILVFPLVIKAQKNAAAMSTILPEMQLYQMKMTEARQSGNSMEAAKYAYKLQEVMKNANCSIMRSFVVPFAQAPIFISYFMALRQMAELPLQTMKTEGLWWFTDLTVADPFYILPLTTSVTLLVIMKLGIEFGASAEALNNPGTKIMMYAIPPITFFFTKSFATAILCYWCTSNIISLFQVLLLKPPKIRKFFGIPPVKKWDPNDLPKAKKGFKEGFMESIDNIKSSRRLNERRAFQQTQFEKAGIGPIKKTYKYDPTLSTNRSEHKK